jgi:hypothetical protein
MPELEGEGKVEDELGSSDDEDDIKDTKYSMNMSAQMFM